MQRRVTTALLVLACLGAGTAAARPQPHPTPAASWEPDGQFGEGTLRSLMAFQRAHGLVPDGFAGRATQALLGLKLRKIPRPGDHGDDVLALQRALKAAARPAAAAHAARPAAHPHPSPAASGAPAASAAASPAATGAAAVHASPPVRPAASPTAGASPAAHAGATPARRGKPLQRLLPSPAPTPEASAAPAATAAAAAAQDDRPDLDLRVGNWFLGGTAIDTLPAGFHASWIAEGAAWYGDWGLGAGLSTIAAYQALAGAEVVSPLVMGSLDLLWRTANGRRSAALGYRRLSTQGVGVLELGTTWERPMVADWLWGRARGFAGTNFSNVFLADGQVGLELRRGPLGLEGGLRALYLNAPGGANTLVAPMLDAHLEF